MAEGAEAVHSHLVNQEQDLRVSLGDLFLEIVHYLEDVVFSEDFVHPNHSFSEDDEEIAFVVALQGVEVGLGDSERLQAVDDDIEQDVVHSLTVLDP